MNSVERRWEMRELREDENKQGHHDVGIQVVHNPTITKPRDAVGTPLYNRL